jgi:hypothetical protein
MSTTCKGPECDREAEVAGMCTSHYMQQRRNGELAPLQTGEHTAAVVFKCPPELKRAAEKAAKAADLTAAEWWREAGSAALERKR